MNINLENIDTEEFNIKEGIIAEDKCFLIYPKINTRWTKENIIFRSSIWNEEGEPVSLGFKKFTNWEENPDVFPKPLSLKNTNIMEKIDGSLLIVSKYKGQLITRTRGTFDAKTLENGYEIEDTLKYKYPGVFNNYHLEIGSLLFEWTSPNNKIILDYGKEPKLILLSYVFHNSYAYAPQHELNIVAEQIKVKRPKIYKYESISSMMKAVENFKGIEGVCIYYNKDQNIKKVKGIDYLKRHAFKSEMSLKNLVEYFIQINRPRYSNFLSIIEREYDFEIREMAIPMVSIICDAMKEVELIIEGMEIFIKKLKGLTRKDQANIILKSYGNTKRGGFVFMLLDGKSLGNKEYKKLLHQILNK